MVHIAARNTQHTKKAGRGEMYFRSFQSTFIFGKRSRHRYTEELGNEASKILAITFTQSLRERKKDLGKTSSPKPLYIVVISFHL